MKKPFQIFSILLLFMASFGCQKISIPNEEAAKIFGKWDYKGNTGGYSGSGGSTRFCSECWVEFTEKGYFNVYDGNKKISKEKFKIEKRNSISGATEKLALVYKNGTYETFQFNGENLLISEEVYDGYMYSFTRK